MLGVEPVVGVEPPVNALKGEDPSKEDTLGVVVEAPSPVTEGELVAGVDEVSDGPKPRKLLTESPTPPKKSPKEKSVMLTS